MIPSLVSEILPCDGFCNGVAVGAGIGYSSRLICTSSGIRKFLFHVSRYAKSYEYPLLSNMRFPEYF